MDDIVTVVLVAGGFFFLGCAFGWFSREQMAMRTVHKMFAEAEKEAAKKTDENTVSAKLEVHNGHFYMFDAETDEFLGQGETKEELSEILRKKFPEKAFVLQKEEYNKLGVFDGKSV